jgi:hypothetical protein
MDTKQLINDAKARFKHNSAKQYLKDKYQAKLLVAYQGGLWKATPELIVFLDSANSDELIILDSYENPVKISNRKEMFYKIRDMYNDIMEEWYKELTELEKNR